MAASIKASGTQSATLDTEHSLLATTDPGTYALQVDLVNMADGDVLELRWKTTVLAGGTIRTLDTQTIYDAQTANSVLFYSPPILYPNGATFTLKQTAGTGRSFPWAVVQP